MGTDQSRRKFIKTGLAISAAGLVSSTGLKPSLGKEKPKVVYRTLGKTGLKVSGVGYGIGFAPIPEVVTRALDMGINYYDTSRVYGDSEKIFGGLIKGRDRSKLVIATKSPSRRKADILKDIDTSLQQLGTDYIDVYHLHARDTPTAIPDEALEAMQEIKKSGKARFLGFSNHDPNRMVDFLLESNTFDIIQTTYSFPIGGYYRDRAIKKLHDAGIGIIAMKVVVALTGLNLLNLDNKPPRDGEGPLSGIKWVLTNPAIGTTVPHMKTISELEMNFRAMSEPYTPADEKTLYVMNEQIRPSYCRMCYECSGKCPQNLPVTDMLRFLAYNDYCGNYHQARMSFMELPDEVKNIRCTDCSECTIKCPNGVHVQDRLIRAQELLA
ncbi:MAG: aldo/keto reductase [Desulfobacteraceae bacterium]|jgi:predicted aldo/keto reductase-like oxidoreductase